jgi:8-oxo-dGTP pyrophosphatase MutT (NUDIX family)
VHDEKTYFYKENFFFMKIFLNDRSVEFLIDSPGNLPPGDLLVRYKSVDELREAWEAFSRYEKYKRMLVVDQSLKDTPPEGAAAFMTFCSFFRIVHAAGGLVKNEHGDFLFIHRLGVWDLPKGKIDKKDSKGHRFSPDNPLIAQKAAIREVKEETGLKNVGIVRELAVTWHTYRDKERWCLKKTRWFEMEATSDQPLQPQTSEAIFLVKWTPPKELHCILGKTYASIRELLLETLF